MIWYPCDRICVWWWNRKWWHSPCFNSHEWGKKNNKYWGQHETKYCPHKKHCQQIAEGDVTFTFRFSVLFIAGLYSQHSIFMSCSEIVWCDTTSHPSNKECNLLTFFCHKLIKSTFCGYGYQTFWLVFQYAVTVLI